MILNDIQNDEGWFFLKITIKLSYFLKKFNNSGVSAWYRLLSNSQHIFLGMTNREFFKSNFKEGFYRSSIFNDEVNIILFLKSKELANQQRLIKELVIRIKKILYVRVEIGKIEDIPSEDRTLLNSYDGIRHYQRILETYFMKP